MHNLPFNAFDTNSARLEIVMAATVLIVGANFSVLPSRELRCCEIATFR
jgi:hypothetical protein